MTGVPNGSSPTVLETNTDEVRAQEVAGMGLGIGVKVGTHFRCLFSSVWFRLHSRRSFDVCGTWG